VAELVIRNRADWPDHIVHFVPDLKQAGQSCVQDELEWLLEGLESGMIAFDTHVTVGKWGTMNMRLLCMSSRRHCLMLRTAEDVDGPTLRPIAELLQSDWPLKAGRQVWRQVLDLLSYRAQPLPPCYFVDIRIKKNEEHRWGHKLTIDSSFWPNLQELGIGLSTDAELMFRRMSSSIQRDFVQASEQLNSGPDSVLVYHERLLSKEWISAASRWLAQLRHLELDQENANDIRVAYREVSVKEDGELLVCLSEFASRIRLKSKVLLFFHNRTPVQATVPEAPKGKVTTPVLCLRN
jgi:hypothetical protein